MPAPPPSPLDPQRPLPDRLAQLDSLHLGTGSSSSFDEGHCALEVVAWLAGEKHSDHPSQVHERRGRSLHPLLE